MRRRVARVGNEVPRMTFLFFLPDALAFFSRRGERLVPAIYSRFEIPRLRPVAFPPDARSPARPSSDTRSKARPCGGPSFRARIFENPRVEGYPMPALRDPVFGALYKTSLARAPCFLSLVSLELRAACESPLFSGV